MKSENIEILLKTLYRNNLHDILFWYTDQDDSLKFSIDCENCFVELCKYAADSDPEEIIDDDIPNLVQSFSDAKKAGLEHYGWVLFASRKRNKTPTRIPHPKFIELLKLEEGYKNEK